MNETECLQGRDNQLMERFLLAGERLQEISMGEETTMEDSFRLFFQKTAGLLVDTIKTYQWIEKGEALENRTTEIRDYFEEISGNNYEISYANPDYACGQLGQDFGKYLSMIYSQMKDLRGYVFQQDFHKVTILLELFLEIYGMFSGEKVTIRQLRETIYWFYYDYAEEWCFRGDAKLLDPANDFNGKIVLRDDYSNESYLYGYGKYVLDEESQLAGKLASVGEDNIETMARHILEESKIDVSSCKKIAIAYAMGSERLIGKLMKQLGEKGMETMVYPLDEMKTQYEYDHQFDQALYLDKRMVDRNVDCLRKLCKDHKNEWAQWTIKASHEETMEFLKKENAWSYNEKQEKFSREYHSLWEEMKKKYICGESREFSLDEIMKM